MDIPCRVAIRFRRCVENGEYQLADLPRAMQSTRENMRALWKRNFWLFFPFVAAAVGIVGLVALFVYSFGSGFGLPNFANYTVDVSLWPPLLHISSS